MIPPDSTHLVTKVPMDRDTYEEGKSVGWLGRITHPSWSKVPSIGASTGGKSAGARKVVDSESSNPMQVTDTETSAGMEMTERTMRRFASVRPGTGTGTGTDANGASDGGVGVMSRAREADRAVFADMWNSVAESWHEEDVINSEQMSKLLYVVDGLKGGKESGAAPDLVISPAFLDEGLLRDAYSSMVAMLKELVLDTGTELGENSAVLFKDIQHSLVQQFLVSCFQDKVVIRAYDWTQLAKLVTAFVKLLVGEDIPITIFDAFREVYAEIIPRKDSGIKSRFVDVMAMILQKFPNILFDPRAKVLLPIVGDSPAISRY
jgi:hypothetical protein